MDLLNRLTPKIYTNTFMIPQEELFWPHHLAVVCSPETKLSVELDYLIILIKSELILLTKVEIKF